MTGNMTALSVADRVVRSKGCLSAEVESETVLMNVESGCYGNLDDIGSDIWRRLKAPVVIAELCDSLAADYDAGRTQIEADVLTFLAALQQQQMIEVVRE